MLLLLLFLFSTIDILPDGMVDAIDAFNQGRINLVFVGELPPVGYRDANSGLLLETLGCEASDEKSDYVSNWNDYMLDQWAYLGSDSTYFVMRHGEESLEYRNCELIYKDATGSVPVTILPEDLAAINAAIDYPLRDSFENIVYVEYFMPLRGEVNSTELAYHTDCIEKLFVEGQLAIRRN